MRASVLYSLIGFACLAITGTFVHSYQSFDAKPQPFSKEEWLGKRTEVELSNDPGCVLGGLTQDLLNKKTLHAKPEQLVLELLGAPNKREGSSLMYFIGQCHGWGWEHSELVVQMSQTGIVLGIQPRASR